MGDKMLTIEQFMKNNDIKKRTTVEHWINEGYILGAKKDDKGEWLIPELARKPYVEARAKDANAIYRSIVYACIKQKSVCAKLYKIPQKEFDVYIDNLKKAGLISVEKINGVEYYYATEKSQEYASKKMSRLLGVALGSIVSAVAEGVAKGTINYLT